MVNFVVVSSTGEAKELLERTAARRKMKSSLVHKYQLEDKPRTEPVVSFDRQY